MKLVTIAAALIVIGDFSSVQGKNTFQNMN